MDIIKNIKIDKKKIKEFSFVFVTLFLITSFLYLKFLNGNYIFASGDFLAPKMISETIKNLEQIYGEYPYWLPSIFGGMPTIHSLQNISDYYIPNYILNILKIFSVPEIWTQLIHLFFAGLGMYTLLRMFEIKSLISLFGATMFILSPYMNVCIVHGHGSQIMTAAYFPWILWGLLKLWEHKSIRNVAILAILIGFQLQRGHIQIAYYTWIMIGIFSIFILSQKFSLKFYLYLFTSLFLGFLMSISILWPSYNYSAHSIRSLAQNDQAYQYATSWSFSFYEMITFLIPSFYGFGGNTYWGTIQPAMTDFPNYLGFFVFIFIIYNFCKNFTKIKIKNNYNNFFWVCSLAFLAISLGNNFFIYDILYSYLPFFSKFRVPMMALMIFQFFIIIIATIGFSHFTNSLKKDKIFESKVIMNILIGLMSIFIILKLFVINNLQIPDKITSKVLNMLHNDINVLLLITFLSLIFLLFYMYNTIKLNYLIIYIFVISIIDMLIIDIKIIDQKHLILESKIVEKSLKPLKELSKINNDNQKKFRIISQTGYNNIKNWAGASNLEDVTGYHPAKLKNYAFFEPYFNTKIGRNFFKQLNVKKIINWNNGWEISSVVESLEPVERIFFVDSLIKYKTDEELLNAMYQDSFNPSKLSYTKSNFDEFTKPNAQSEIKINLWTPNKIIIESNLITDNFVALSEIYYPNWEITSHDIDIIQINGLLRGFVAPKGKNTIIMEFKINDIKYSSLISNCVFITLVLLFMSTYLPTFKREQNDIL